MFSTLDALPDFTRHSQSEKYRVRPYLQAASEIQTLGEQEGSQLLLSLVSSLQRSFPPIIILARMLFTKKEGDFRSSLLGWPAYIGGTVSEDWPLCPITLVEGIPFLIVRGYAVDGCPEHPANYIEYCLQHCAWNTFQFEILSEQKLIQSLEAFLSSSVWKKPLTDFDKDFLRNQIKS